MTTTTAKSRERVRTALHRFLEADVLDGTTDLLADLGYKSDLTLELSGDVDEFIHELPAPNPGTQSEERFREDVQSVKIIHQFTDNEIGTSASIQGVLMDEEGTFDKGHNRSFIFVAFELKGDDYSRGKYAEFTREINKRFASACVVVFKNPANLVTLAFVNRREHKRDKDRDVLGNVSLIRQVEAADPHTAHLDILAELSLTNMLKWMDQHNKPTDFDGLLDAWLDTLDTQELNKRFYSELFDWFERAVEESKFPTNQAKTIPAQEHVVRLITRLMFVWFIKEKDLIADQLFNESQIKDLLKNYDRDTGDSYYRAILQNLFFGTLNTEIKDRRFSTKTRDDHRNFSVYRYRDEIADERSLRDLFAKTPFINGGLFDCLDDFLATRSGGYRIDCFSDNKTHRNLLSLPNRLFFDEHGIITLFEKYKFTVEENTPAEQEVALDPELLGSVFENLLAAINPETKETARKQTGSYYTPRPVVEYMVDEALVASLSDTVKPVVGERDFLEDRIRYLLDYNDAFDDGGELFEPDETSQLVDAIAKLKVLDPAVGSGAFPMGMLHKLTLALKRLDPENQEWEELQKQIAVDRAERAFGMLGQRERDIELTAISDTFQRYRDSDFGRKLYLIQNSIFGVDKQSIACQIAKLRFFISLAVEQHSSQDSNDNFGVKPLPNLETRFVAADTLVGLENTTQGSLGQTSTILNIQNEINDNRERYFHANARQMKLDCIGRDARLRASLAQELQQNGMPAAEAGKIAQLDLFDQNTSSDWFDPWYMFNVDGGFNIVIGNPPYVEARNKLLTPELKALYGSQIKIDWNTSLPRGSDLLIYFFAKSANLLADDAIGCLITQNAWLNTDYGFKFQCFTKNRVSFERIVDSTGKFFPDTDSQNINAVISVFSRSSADKIKFEIIDETMTTQSTKLIDPYGDTKWGSLIAMPDFFRDVFATVQASEIRRSQVKFGQGLNFTKSEIDVGNADVPIFDDDGTFVYQIVRHHIRSDLAGRRITKIPALIMPRGIGNRYFCAFNFARGLSYSAVEAYLPDRHLLSDLHYTLWLYLNSSFAWLYREITGRKNLGGGMLKAEATDMKQLPVEFDFDFADEARGIYASLSDRDPMPVAQEVMTDEHIRIDELVAAYFGFEELSAQIRDTLVRQVGFRNTRAKRRR